ncbi:UNVERIFIED_CONTAM: 50S ribosomal protein L18, chloroplastic [Sesamum angustifolium]|uniref:50S ribosomal protein L18, chloroplastic n=1 Tax=Sesamum angustifolium TaxID=2727405 RepID=A0AAW2Q8R4_9LAMI
MAIGSCIAALKFQACGSFGTSLNNLNILPLYSANLVMKPLVIEARANTRTESAKIQNRRLRKKFNGTATKPRLSVFCSDKQLYAMLVDDQNKKCLFYGSTLQKSVRKDQSCTTVEAAERVGEELIKTCVDLNINEISSYDRNGLARGERIQSFEIAVGRHGFLPR